jgi:small membrane protein
VIPIQAILVLALALGLYLYLTRLRSTLLDRVLVFLASGAVLLLVIFPELSTVVAGWLGVGRGVDLVFYLAHAGVALVIILLYAKLRRQEDQIQILTRELALRSARVPPDAGDSKPTQDHP